MGLVAGTKFWSLRLDFAAKIASSHDATVVDLKVLNCTKFKIKLELHFTLSILKVGTLDGTSPCD